MKKVVIIAMVLLGWIGSFTATATGEDGDIKFRDPEITNNDDPQAPAACRVLGKYVEGGVVVYSHTDGMATVTAEDEEGATFFEAVGNLGTGIFVALPDSYDAVKITVVFGGNTFIAEI